MNDRKGEEVVADLAVIEGGGAHGAELPATRQVDLLAVARQAEAAKALGKTLIASGFLPDAIKKPEQAVVVILKGQELSLPPLYALSHIAIIQGKPAMSAEVMRALVHRAGHKIRIVETTRERAVVEGVRRDDPNHPVRITFDEEDARRAGLAGKGGHKTYPAALKLARATSALCRAAFADAIGGISYVPEELGAEVDEEGRIVDAEPTADPEAAVEGEVVDDDRREALTYAEHQDLLDRIDEVLLSIPEGQRPDRSTTLEYAGKKIGNARKALERVERIWTDSEAAKTEDVEGDEESIPDWADEKPSPDLREMQGAARQATRGQDAPARKSQVDLLKTIAEELRPGEGAERLAERVGKPLEELTRAQAEEWIERLDPDGVDA